MAQWPYVSSVRLQAGGVQRFQRFGFFGADGSCEERGFLSLRLLDNAVPVLKSSSKVL